MRGRKTPVDFTTRDDAPRRHRRVRPRASSRVRRPLVRQRAGRGRGAGGAGARSRGVVDGIPIRARRAGRCRRGGSRTPTSSGRRAVQTVGARAGAARMERRDARCRDGPARRSGPGGARSTSCRTRRARRRARRRPPMAAQMIAEAMRRHPERADALLQKLAARLVVARLADGAARRARRRAGRRAARALAAGWGHGALRAPARRDRCRAPPVQRHRTRARRRRRRSARDRRSTPTDWDRSTAINAPGQSGSPDSAHFADLVGALVGGRHRSRSRSASAPSRRTPKPR